MRLPLCFSFAYVTVRGVCGSICVCVSFARYADTVRGVCGSTCVCMSASASYADTMRGVCSMTCVRVCVHLRVCCVR